MGLISGAIGGALEGAGKAGVTAIHTAQEQYGKEQLQAAEQEFQMALEGTRQAGADRRLGVTEQGQDRRQGVSETGMDRRQAVTETGQDRRQGVSEAGANTRQGAQIASSEKIASDALKSHERLASIANGIAAGHLQVARETANINNAVGQIKLDNEMRVRQLKDEYAFAKTPEARSRISENLSILTGKDTDKFLPVPLKDDMGNITGYRIFDTKNGAWKDQGAPAPKTGDRPPLSSFGGAPANPPAAAPAATPAPAAAQPAAQNRSTTIPGMGLIAQGDIPARIAEFQPLFDKATKENNVPEMVRIGNIIQSLKAGQNAPGI